MCNAALHCGLDVILFLFPDACPDIGCANRCKFGYKIKPNGCPGCECNPPTFPGMWTSNVIK